MPHRSQHGYTLRIRNLSPELSLARYSMVWCSIHPHIFSHLGWSTALSGVATAMFFKCMGVLLSPTDPIKGAKKWALISHTVAMFAFLTIPTGIGLNFSSTCYINNREFPGNGEYPPGPIGYDSILRTEVANVVFTAMFPLNQWLADGLLVGLISNCVAWVFSNAGQSSSCTVAMSFILRTFRPWSSHA